MNRHLLELVPERLKGKLGSGSRVCPLSGQDVFTGLRDERTIVMGCNPRIPHVIPGIMKAAEELDAVVTFELSRSEGDLDGGYTGQTPESFCSTLLEYADNCNFTKPFVIHADHISVPDSSEPEIDAAEKLIQEQIRAGFTSFSIDASSMPVNENIRVTKLLSSPLEGNGCGLELALGGVKHVGTDTKLTELSETHDYLSGIVACGLRPHLLSIDNGSKSGNYLDGQMVLIDLERTGEIFIAAREYGVSGLVQHGITGTPLRIVGRLSDYGIRKGNIGTLWQNVAHAGLPLDLMDVIRSWAKKHNKDIRYATGIFKSDIDSIPVENIRMIQDMACREAREFLKAFHAQGSATRLAERLCGS